MIRLLGNLAILLWLILIFPVLVVQHTYYAYKRNKEGK